MLGSELKLRIKPKYGVPYEGTMDLWFAYKGKECIVDTKTSGIMGPFIGKGAAKKQSWTKMQVTFMIQLIHYHWMMHRLGMSGDVVRYGIFTPSNLTRYLTGPKKGTRKGDAVFWSEATPLSRVLKYEESLFEWIEGIRQGRYPRQFPSVFGKIACGNCPAVEACLGDTVTIERPANIPYT